MYYAFVRLLALVVLFVFSHSAYGVVETHRILIHNVRGGAILGSRDSGLTWIKLGQVTSPISGGVWRPSVDAGVTAFDYQRGNSSVFATAVNAIHLRFSDPDGYALPADTSIPPVSARGVSILPLDPRALATHKKKMTKEEVSRVAMTNIPAGTSLFGKEWSPTVGSHVFMGDGKSFAPIPYHTGPNDRIPERSYLLIVSQDLDTSMEAAEFENQTNGLARVFFNNGQVKTVGKVTKPVQGIGRFIGSEHVPAPGVIRANHSGVICVGTTDLNVDPEIPKGPIAESTLHTLRGGFQIVPSHHFQDRAMRNGSDHPEVYMVIGPVEDPPHLQRYDMGIDGRAPLFKFFLHAGKGKTYVRFPESGQTWHELNDAIANRKFRTQSGIVIPHLRGFIRDALHEVTAIRIEQQ